MTNKDLLKSLNTHKTQKDTPVSCIKKSFLFWYIFNKNGRILGCIQVLLIIFLEEAFQIKNGLENLLTLRKIFQTSWIQSFKLFALVPQTICELSQSVVTLNLQSFHWFSLVILASDFLKMIGTFPVQWMSGAFDSMGALLQLSSSCGNTFLN